MDKFNWTDELVFEFTNFYEEYCKTNKLVWTSVAVEAFKKSKESKKDYEILSFQRITNGDVEWVLNENGDYTNISSGCAGFSFDRLYGIGYEHEKNVYTVLNGQIRIHSVRRLSDGEVFTVGDKITWGIPEDLFVTKINGFKIVNGRLEIDHDSFVKNISVDFEGAYKLKKVKEPLFTTEDGVEIHEGDKYWHVSRTYDIAPCKADKDVKYNLFESRTFSTKKAAEEYIIINKPCLSITDVGSVLSGNLSLRVAAELKELVKSKL